MAEPRPNPEATKARDAEIRTSRLQMASDLRPLARGIILGDSVYGEIMNGLTPIQQEVFIFAAVKLATVERFGRTSTEYRRSIDLAPSDPERTQKDPMFRGIETRLKNASIDQDVNVGMVQTVGAMLANAYYPEADFADPELDMF